MLSGTVRTLAMDKGFGFIQPDDGTADVFFHRTAVAGALESLAVGQSVSYTLQADAPRARALSVQPGPRGRAKSSRPQRPRREGGQRSDRARGGATMRSRPARSPSRPGDTRPPQRQRVRPAGGTAERNANQSAKRDANQDRPATSRVRVRADREYGFVTKLHRATGDGYISSVEHGPELLFAATAVAGKKSYADLRPGDYVAFVRERQVADPQKPVARLVIATDRERPTARVSLPRHKRARGKKPSWRIRHEPNVESDRGQADATEGPAGTDSSSLIG